MRKILLHLESRSFSSGENGTHSPLTYMNEKNEVVKEMIPGTLEENLIDLMNEPYEEALKIVQTTPPNPNQR